VRNRLFRLPGNDPHRQGADPADEIRIEPLRGTDNFETKIPLQNLFPENPQLSLGKPIADAAMNAGVERQVLLRLGPINDEFIGAVDLFYVAAQPRKQRPPSIIMVSAWDR